MKPVSVAAYGGFCSLIYSDKDPGAGMLQVL